MQKQLEIEKTKPTFIILTYQYNKYGVFLVFFFLICNLLIFKISQGGKSVHEKKNTWTNLALLITTYSSAYQ